MSKYAAQKLIVVLLAVFGVGCVTVRTDTAILLEYLKEENSGMRYLGTKMLGLKKEKKAVPILADLLLRDECPSVRHACAISLGNIGDPRALPALTKALTDEGEFWVIKPSGKRKLIVKEAALSAVKRIQGRR